MATGDDALAAGMALTPGTVMANTIDTEINLTRDYIAQRTSTVTPITKGGTGATNAAAARTALSVPSIADLSTKLTKTDAQYGNDFAFRDAAIATKLGNSTDTMGGSLTVNGHIYVPNSSAATSGFTVCYINADGRISRGSSSERYKKFIHSIAPEELGDIWPEFKRYQMRADGLTPADSTWRYGYIAESLIGTDAECFAVIIEGQVESIDFIGLLLAQVAQLHARERERDMRIANLFNRVETLESQS